MKYCSTKDARDAGSIPELGRSPGRGHGNLLQYMCLENPKDRGVRQATVHRITQSWARLQQLRMHIKKNEIMPFTATWMRPRDHLSK